MNRLLVLTVIVAISSIGCGLGAGRGLSLAPGMAIVESSDLTAEARLCSAYVTTKQLGDEEFEAIVIDLPRGMTLEILSRDLSADGTMTKDGDGSSFVMASLHDKGIGRHFLAESANLTFVENSRLVRGKFSFGMRDALSSCMNCPGTWIEVTGEFYAAFDDKMVVRRAARAKS